MFIRILYEKDDLRSFQDNNNVYLFLEKRCVNYNSETFNVIMWLMPLSLSSKEKRELQFWDASCHHVAVEGDKAPLHPKERSNFKLYLPLKTSKAFGGISFAWIWDDFFVTRWETFMSTMDYLASSYAWPSLIFSSDPKPGNCPISWPSSGWNSLFKPTANSPGSVPGLWE